MCTNIYSNRKIFDKVIAKIKWCSFFASHYIYIYISEVWSSAGHVIFPLFFTRGPSFFFGWLCTQNWCDSPQLALSPSSEESPVCAILSVHGQCTMLPCGQDLPACLPTAGQTRIQVQKPHDPLVDSKPTWEPISNQRLINMVLESFLCTFGTWIIKSCSAVTVNWTETETAVFCYL